MPSLTSVRIFRHTLHDSCRVSATLRSATGLLHFISYYIGAGRLQYHCTAFRPSALRNLSDSVALRLRPSRPLIELSVMVNSDTDEDELFEMWNRQTLYTFSAAEDRDVR
jgi:hypothetical protein